MDSSRRKKSCRECAKAKRKCSLGTPCQRCARQGWQCKYPDLPSQAISRPNEHQLPAHANPSIPESLGETSDFDCPAVGTDFLDSVDASFGAGGPLDLALLPAFSPVRTSKLSFSSTLKSFQLARVEYPCRVLMAAPASFVYENQTPWAHVLLWEDEMPKCLRDAYAASALYMSRNEVNSHFVSRHLELCVNEVLQLPPPTTFSECLARTQALLLYTCIQIFGTDFRSHAQAMESLYHLDAMAFRLHGFASAEKPVPPSQQLQLFPLTETRAFWHSWLRHESAQRTIQTSFFIYAVASLLTGTLGACEKHTHVSTRVTLSAHLWAARSPLDFASAWNERDHLQLWQQDCSRVMTAAMPEDLDIFGKMHLVAVLGIDDIKGWYRTKGSDFDNTGPDILTKWGIV